MHESVLAYRKRRYLWLSLIVIGTAVAAYWLDDPQEPANGGTTLGYTLGTVAAMLVAWLTWFGVRKRRYASTLGTVQGWLSAHVYLGLALVVIALLHTGFQFGYNVHTLALVLMLLVVASGLFGVIVYLRYPRRMSENRGGAPRSELVAQLEDIDRRSLRVAENLGAEFAEFAASGVQRTRLGATLTDRLRRRDNSQIVVRSGGDTRIVANARQEAALDWLAEQQSMARDGETIAAIGELSALIRSKRRLLKQLGDDLRLQAMLEIWLYAHVPLTAALLVALTVHVVTVFLYW
ncbi:MAG: hypothetical protein R3288_08975 [Woeseiaceae bacterium]|nr:hypothetical protein [Woeseiaceae bacterium]